MKRIILNYAVLFILILLQTSRFAETLRIGNIRPDFVITFIVYVSLTASLLFAETLCFIGGIVLDIMSYSLLGVNGFVLTVLSVLLSRFKTQIFVEKAFSVFIVVFLSSLAYRILYLLLTVIFVVKINFFNDLLRISLPEALYSAVAGVILFPLYNYIFYRR